MNYIDFFISVWLKFFFLLTPFFAVTIFLVMTKEMDVAQRRFTAIKTTGAIILICLVLYYFGNMYNAREKVDSCLRCEKSQINVN